MAMVILEVEEPSEEDIAAVIRRARINPQKWDRLSWVLYLRGWLTRELKEIPNEDLASAVAFMREVEKEMED